MCLYVFLYVHLCIYVYACVYTCMCVHVYVVVVREEKRQPCCMFLYTSAWGEGSFLLMTASSCRILGKRHAYRAKHSPQKFLHVSKSGKSPALSSASRIGYHNPFHLLASLFSPVLFCLFVQLVCFLVIAGAGSPVQSVPSLPWLALLSLSLFSLPLGLC